jgi:protein O-GlcNAc transferase
MEFILNPIIVELRPYEDLFNESLIATSKLSDDPINCRIAAICLLYKIILKKESYVISNDLQIVIDYNFATLIKELLTYVIFDEIIFIKLFNLSLKSYKNILDNDPFHLNGSKSVSELSLLLSKINNSDVKIELYHNILNMIPEDYNVYYNLGIEYEKLNDNKALYYYRLAISLSQDDVFIISVHMRIFSMFHLKQNYKMALIYMLKAHEKYPEHVNIINNIGFLYMKMDNLDKAGGFFEKVIYLVEKQEKTEETIKFLSLLYSNYAYYLNRVFDFERAEHFQNQASLTNPQSVSALQSSITYLNFKKFTFDNRMYSTEQHKKINELLVKTRNYVFSENTYKSNKINIGYVSGDLITSHPVYFFLSTFLLNHDRNLFNVICYSQSICNLPPIQSVTIKYINNKSAGEVSDIIYNDNIHILFDLSGHMSENRLDVFKNKPSPIQITYIGYPFTTGLNEMDYRITDTICESNLEISQPYYTEKLLCLDNCFLCYNPPTIEVLQEKEKDEYLNIGCYNRQNKMSPFVLNLFIQILVNNKKVKFFFNSPSFKNGKIKDDFVSKFPEDVRDRIFFIISGNTLNGHFLTLNNINVQIDTNPYSGTTTSCESLLMGVPIFTIYDDVTCFHCTNVTSSLLINSDLEYYVCKSPNDVEQKIVELQNQPQEFWLTFKQTIRDKFFNGKVCNKQLHIANMTKLLVDLYNKHSIGNNTNLTSIQKDAEELYQAFLNKEWIVDWNSIPLENSELECVIVEPRCHPNLVRVLNNFCSKLNKYSFTWYHSKTNSSFLDDKLPQEALAKIKKVEICDDNLTIYEYNNLLTSPSFWKSINAKRTLIFQTDAGCIKDNIEDFLQYDYIGAPWPNNHTTRMISHNLICGNGGLSLRNTRLMEKICDNPNILYDKMPEDYFFSRHVYDFSKSMKSIIVPQSIEEASLFSSELILNSQSFGFHAVYKYGYNSYENIKSFFNKI